MKKYFTLLMMAIAISHISIGQKLGKTKFSIGPEIGWAASNPLSDLQGNKGWGIGLGGSLLVEHFFQEKLSGVIYGGFISYAGRARSSNSKNKAYNVIPIRVGGNYYIGNKFHLGAQIGVGLNSKADESATSFAYTPNIGYNFSRQEKPLDLTLKYDGFAGNGGFSAIGIRLSLIL